MRNQLFITWLKKFVLSSHNRIIKDKKTIKSDSLDFLQILVIVTIVITIERYGLSNAYLVGAVFLYSSFAFRLVNESIFSLALFLKKTE